MAPTGYNNSTYSSSGLSSRNNNGLGRLGGSFQSNRGSLTKLSGGITRASSLGGTAAGLSNVNAPKPINTSSLRKENGGQDISTVLVNRQGGKVGWGSSLPEKQDDQSPGRAVKPNDPTPEEAGLKTIDTKVPMDFTRREISTNTSSSHPDSQAVASSPKLYGKVTPWTSHPPNAGLNDNGVIVEKNPSHNVERRTHNQPFHKEDTPHLQDEIHHPSNHYDRGNYSVDRYNQDPYDRDYGGRGHRYYPHGNDGVRDDTMYRSSSNTYRRYPDQDGHYYRDSRDLNTRQSSYSEQRMYDRGRDRLYDRESSYDGYNNTRETYDRPYNSTNYDRHPPSRSDPRSREVEPPYLYRKDEKIIEQTREEHLTDNGRTDYRGFSDDSNGRNSKYDYSRRDFMSGTEFHRPRSYVRSFSDVDRFSRSYIGDDTQNRSNRDFVRTERENQTNYSSSDSLARGSERKNDDTSNRSHSRSFKPESSLDTDRSVPEACKPQASTLMNHSSSLARKPDVSTKEVSVPNGKTESYEPKNSQLNAQFLEEKNLNNASQDITKECIVESNKEKTVENSSNTNVPSNHKKIRPQISARKWDHDDDDSDDDVAKDKHISPTLDGEQQRMSQQQIILQRVQDMRKKTTIQDSDNDHVAVRLNRENRDMRKTSTTSIEKNENDHDAIQAARDERRVTSSIDEKNVISKMSTQPVVSCETCAVIRHETNEKSDKESSKEIYLAKLKAERAARLEHRRTREPRTKGVLFKRDANGILVNADVNRRGRNEDQKRPTGGDSKTKRKNISASDANVDDTTTYRPNFKAPKSLRKVNDRKLETESFKDHSNNVEPSTSPSEGGMITAIESEHGKQSIANDRVQEVNFSPSIPPVSAWSAGPPPSIFNTNNTPNENQTVRDSEIDHFSKSNRVEAPADDLPSKLLTSWSPKATSSKSTIAKGPIISTWSSLQGNDVGLFQPFNSSKQDSTPTASDWNMDFALPRDLLSPTVEDIEEPSNHEHEAHNADQLAPSHDHDKTAQPRKYSRRPFALSSKKPSFQTKRNESNITRSRMNQSNTTDGQPNIHNDSNEKPKSIPQRRPNSTPEDNELGGRHKTNARRFPISDTNELDSRQKASSRRFPNGTKAHTKRNEPQTKA